MDNNYPDSSAYANSPMNEVLALLDTTMDGLTKDEAMNRIRKWGSNDIPEAKVNVLLAFLKRFWGPMPWLLEFAIILTFILHHNVESIIIATLLILNAIIGQMQARNSQNAVKMLKRKLQIKAKILRNGNWLLEDSKSLVPGDIVMIKLGDMVAADVYILDGEISVDQSALTGESLPKDLRPGEIVYSSSIINRGEAQCVVVNTGIKTRFGKTVELVKSAKPKSKQEELMLAMVKNMLYLGIAASVIVSIYAIYLQKDIVFILSFVVVFLIGAIPVALPAVLTIVQAVGAIELSKKGVLVTRLDSIEDAASIDIFCFDKTGTITQNVLTVIESEGSGTFNAIDVVRIAALASQSQSMDAIDLAILNYAHGLNIDFEGYERISYKPFNPAEKKTEATLSFHGKALLVMKGAAQTILGLCQGMEDDERERANRTVERFAEKGARAIAVAIRENEVVTFVGLLALADPPRDDSKQMIQDIKTMGIKILMLTGDSLAIAQEIATQVGIGQRIYRTDILDGRSQAEQWKIIQDADGFAEVYPADKYRIVKTLQESGHMVGMTGDGVNDSPALKQAELGTAVSDATDVAKASASIVLTKPGLSEILDAIKISRKTYQRMLTWVINKTIKVIEVVLLFTIGFFWLHQLVITLLGMTLLVFANDFVTMSIATDNVEATVTPNKWDMQNITLTSFMLSMLFVIGDLLLIFIGLNYFKLSFEKIQTLVLLSLVFNTQLRILIVRNRKHFWSSVPSKHLLMVNSITIISFVLLGTSGYLVPALAITQVLTILGVSIGFAFLIDFAKYYLYKKFSI
jgi:H+-transporting ATPase